MKRIVFFILIVGIFVGDSAGQDPRSPELCDFTKFNPTRISHVLLKAVTHKTAPVYPASAKFVKAKGRVDVSIVISRQGNVVAACATSGHPLLRDSAEKAALEWKFKRNFGLKSKLKIKFIQDSITFWFSPD